MVRDQEEEGKWKGLGVNEHWQQMKRIMMETAQDICGMTKSPCRHKETWWWNEEVAEAVRDKKLSYHRGTARCVVLVEILPNATQQCRKYLYDKS